MWYATGSWKEIQERTILGGSPKCPLIYLSMKTIRAAKRPCKTTGTMIAPWIAPLIKRKASGHLVKHQHAPLRAYGAQTFVVSVVKFGQRGLSVYVGGVCPWQIHSEGRP